MAVNRNIDEDAAAAMRASAWEKGVLTGQQSAAAAPVPEEPANEQERRNAQDNAYARDERWLAEAGALSEGQIFTMGAGSNKGKSGEESAKRRRENANSDARMQALLALQAQLDQVRLEINGLENALDYLNRTGDVHGTLEMPYVKEAIAAWEEENDREFDPEHPDAEKHIRTAIEGHRARKLETEADLESTQEEGFEISLAELGAKAQRIESAISSGNNAALSYATSLAISDEEKLAQYDVEGMTDRQQARLLAESNADSAGSGFPSFAQEIDSEPAFMAQSHTENFNSTASYESDNKEPQNEVALGNVPDFMNNSG